MAALLSVVVGCGTSDSATPVEQGQALLRSGHFDDAITALGDAVRIDPRNADAYLFRGRAYQCRNETGDLDAAIDDFATAIELAPQDHEAYYSRAIALRDRSKATNSTDDAQRSEADHAQARKLDPEVAKYQPQLPDITVPPETEHDPESVDTATIESSIAPEPEETETTADVLRRLELEAAAAVQGDEFDARRDNDLRSGRSSGYSDGNSTRPATDNSRPQETSRTRRLRREEQRTIERLQARESAGGSQWPLADPRRGLPAGSPLDPRTGASVGSLTPMSPAQGNFARPRSGGTLPPVATSPFSTRSPLAGPSIPGAPIPGAPISGAQGASPNRSPYQSPFPQHAPRPTGYVEPPLTAPPLGSRPRR